MSEIDCYSGNIIHDLDDGAEGTHSKLADGAKPGVADTPEGHATIQRDLNRMVKWADRNLKQFNKGTYEVVHMERNSPRYQSMLGAD